MPRPSHTPILAAALVLLAALVFSMAPRSAAQGPAAPLRIATVDIYKVSGKLVAREVPQNRIKGRQAELAAEIKPLEDELNRLSEQLRTLAPEDRSQAAQALAQSFERTRQTYAQRAQEADNKLNAFIAQVNFEAFKEALDSVNAIADRRGYTHVLSARGSDDMPVPTNSLSFVQGLLSRPVLRSPVADDITPDVLADLNLN